MQFQLLVDARGFPGHLAIYYYDILPVLLDEFLMCSLLDRVCLLDIQHSIENKTEIELVENGK